MTDLGNDAIDHGDDQGHPTDIGRNHGLGRVTWYSKMRDLRETIFGVAMDDGFGTSVAKLGDIELLGHQP